MRADMGTKRTLLLLTGLLGLATAHPSTPYEEPYREPPSYRDPYKPDPYEPEPYKPDPYQPEPDPYGNPYEQPYPTPSPPLYKETKPKYPPPPPKHPQHYQKCEVKEWASDTELCQPELERDCEELELGVRQIVWPGFDGYNPPECKPSKLPHCSVTDDAAQFRLCSTRVRMHRSDLMATLYEQELVKRCDTHYVTQCRPGYRYGAPGYKQQCATRPVQTCYDAPHLRKVEVPIKIKMATLEDNCQEHLVPTPRTTCWDKDAELCPHVPELSQSEQKLYKCSHRISEDKCQRVRLTIPREICHPAERYHPYPPKPLYTSVKKSY